MSVQFQQHIDLDMLSRCNIQDHMIQCRMLENLRVSTLVQYLEMTMELLLAPSGPTSVLRWELDIFHNNSGANPRLLIHNPLSIDYQIRYGRSPIDNTPYRIPHHDIDFHSFLWSVHTSEMLSG